MGFNNFINNIEFLYDALTSSTDNYTFIYNLEKNCFLISDNMKEDFGFDNNIITNGSKVWMELVHERDRERIRRTMEMIYSIEDIYDEEYQIRNMFGFYIWIRTRGKVYRDPKTNEFLYFVGNIENLERQGMIDSITGLYYYEKGKEQVEQEFRKKEGGGGILVFDLDDFTTINALHTHEFGDLVLRNMVVEIQKILPKNATMYRMDGDQFFITYFGATRNDMEELFSKIQNYTLEYHEIDGMRYQFTISAGITMFDFSCTWAELLKRSIIVMKHVKESGKNHMEFYRKEILDRKLRNQQLIQEFQESIRNGCEGFYLVLQPICSVQDVKLEGAEALLRYKSKQFGLLSPVEFIPILEQSGLIVLIGRWVFEQAIRICKKITKYIPDFIININVSLKQTVDYRFCKDIIKWLERYELSSKNIVLELTESCFIQDEDSFLESLKFLRSMGIKIAMDDFGTGYSSLGRLQEIDVDIVKIDRSFISSIYDKGYNYNFVKAVISLCHNAGLKVCVEGVEEREELKSINSLYADTFQGYYTSKPVEEDYFLN